MTTTVDEPGVSLPVAAPNPNVNETGNLIVHKVKTPSGQTITVQTDRERDFYESQRDAYMHQNGFDQVTDRLDLDRLLFLELTVFRATSHLGSGRDYYGDMLNPASEQVWQRKIKECSLQISTIKNDLGLSKSQRDKAQYESVGTYITDLKARAREHGVKREAELTKMLCLGKELFSIIGTFDRSDAVEREKIGFVDEAAVLDWIRGVMVPEFNRIDEHFRQNQQKFWVRKI